MKMLITGSSGFIGRTLVKNIEGIPCDISSSDTKPNCDVTNVDDIINSSKDCDGIIHLAALSRVADCESEPQICIDINIKGTLNVIQAAVKNKINWVGIVTTGEVKWIENREIQSFKRINNVYGISKLAGELLLDVYTEKTNLQSTIFRISSVVLAIEITLIRFFHYLLIRQKVVKK